MTSPTSPVSSRPVVVMSLVWLAATVLLGVTGVFTRIASPAPQLFALVLTVVAIVISTTVPNVRAWVDSLSLRSLVGIHAIRFIGIAFLVLGARGQLSPLFAERAGWGDISAATGAVLLVLTGVPRSSTHRWVYLAWNTFGVLDLIVAVSTAAIVVIRGYTPGMQLLGQLPLIIVPVLAVPFLFAAHVAIYRRLLSGKGSR